MISVVIPTYNSERTILRTLESVGAIQTFQKSTQVIVMDGASTDKTREICKSFKGSIEFYSERDAGVYDAMNKSLGLARNNWILFLGSDDILLNSCTSIFRYLTDLDCSYYGDVVLSRDGRRYGGPFSSLRLSLANICHQSIFYSRRALMNNRYNLEFTLMADYDLNLRLYSKGAAFVHVPVLIAEYNNVSGKSSVQRDRSFQRRKLGLIRKYFGTAFAFKYILTAFLVNKIGGITPYVKDRILRV